MRAQTKAAVAYLPAIDHLPIFKTAHLCALAKASTAIVDLFDAAYA